MHKGGGRLRDGLTMRASAFALWGIVLAIAAGALLLAPGYDAGGWSADARISLSDLSTVDNVPPYKPDTSRLRFAVAAVLSPRATIENYQMLASYLSARLNRPVEIVQSKSYAETNSLVRSGDAALALVCSGAFVAGRQDFGMQPLVVPVVNGQTTYHSYLIVRSTSTIRSWDDLRHKRFAFTDPLSNSGRLVPVFLLSRKGETPEKFFDDFIFTYSHDKSVQAVADGLVDAAAVDSLVYDFMVQNVPSLTSRVKVIWVSPPYGINPVVVNPNIAQGLRSELESIFLGMHTDPEGQKVLAQLGIDSFRTPDPRAYDSIEAMLQATAVR